MVERKDIEKLAALARITIPENEIEKTRIDVEKILAYVGQINEANDLAVKGKATSGASDKEFSSDYDYSSGVKNVLREDSEPHESGMFTDAILKNAPKTERGFIKVKKIL